MTYPTPTGAAPAATQFTSADTITYINSRLTAAQRASFDAYYDQAVKQDPAITPFQAYTVWVTGTSISGGLGTATTALGEIPQAAATGAENAAKTLSITNPLDFLGEIGNFFSALTQPNTWLRIAKVLMGGVLVIAGLIKLTGASKDVYGIAGKAASVLPMVAA